MVELIVLIVPIVIIIIPLAFSLFSKLFPLKNYEMTPEKHTELSKKYKKWDIITFLLILPLIVVMSAFWTVVISFFGEWGYQALGKSLFIIYPEKAYWLVPSMLLGIISSALPLYMILKAILKDKYSEYIAYTYYQNKFDGMKVFSILSWIIVPLCIIFVVLGMNWYTRFTENNVSINEYFSLQERLYDYKQIDTVYHVQKFKAPNGNILDNPYYVIVFKDKYQWKNMISGVDEDTIGKKVINYLKNDKKIKVEEIEFLKK